MYLDSKVPRDETAPTPSLDGCPRYHHHSVPFEVGSKVYLIHADNRAQFQCGDVKHTHTHVYIGTSLGSI